MKFKYILNTGGTTQVVMYPFLSHFGNCGTHIQKEYRQLFPWAVHNPTHVRIWFLYDTSTSMNLPGGGLKIEPSQMYVNI